MNSRPWSLQRGAKYPWAAVVGMQGIL